MKAMDALHHAAKAHQGQKDKCGVDYLLHPIAVAQAIRLDRNLPLLMTPDEIESAVVIALLHDVLEDTEYPLPIDKLSPAEGMALRLLTRSEGQTYSDYIAGICSGILAPIVKLADLWHNLQPDRQACLPQPEQESLEERYINARTFIWETKGHNWWPGKKRGEQ